jgi:hypothetical protein
MQLGYGSLDAVGEESSARVWIQSVEISGAKLYQPGSGSRVTAVVISGCHFGRPKLNSPLNLGNAL